MIDCLFCKIINKDLPSERTVYEDGHVFVMLDVHPCTEGHVLVLPKVHAENIIELPKDITKPLFETVKKMTAILQETLSPAGFTIGINHGRVSGQSIDHLHIHVIPRYEGDGGGSLHSIFKKPSVGNTSGESLKELASKLREKI